LIVGQAGRDDQLGLFVDRDLAVVAQVLLPKLGDRPVRRKVPGGRHAIRHILFHHRGVSLR
jgi:hypothetical protein